jgi:hypothetical protein
MTKLNHTFGDDGVFWISYKDLIRKYEHFDRTRLFHSDANWKSTQQWTSLAIPWTIDYSDTKFEITLTKEGPVVIVLTQLDDRYFRGLEGQYEFKLHFRLEKEGEEEYIVRSHGNYGMRRSVSTELTLEPGKYIVQLKITANRDQSRPTVEKVVRDNCKDSREKLLQIGLSYDLSHAKGEMTESAEEKKEREAKEKAKKEKEKKKAKEEKKAAKKKEKERLKKLEEKQKKAEAKEAKKVAREEKKQRIKDRQEKKLAEEKAKKEGKKITVEETETEAKEETEEEKKDVEKSPEQEKTPPPEEQETVVDDKAKKADEVTGPDGPDGPSTNGETKEAAVQAPDPSETKEESEDEVLSSSDSSSDSDSDSDSEDEEAVEEEGVQSEIDADDEFASDPWNAVCVLGLKVYSKDSEVTVQVVRPKEDEGPVLDVDAQASDATEKIHEDAEKATSGAKAPVKEVAESKTEDKAVDA